MPQQQVTLDFAARDFLLSREAMRCSPNTITVYSKVLQNWERHLDGLGVHHVGEVTPAHIRGYLVALQRRGLTANGVHLHARTLRTFFRFLTAEEVLTVNPFLKVTMPPRDKLDLPAYSRDDVRRLLAHCDHARDKAAVLFLLDSGCRASEFIALDVGDVDLTTGAVQIRRGKGGKNRTTYIGVKARRALVKYLAERGEVGPDAPLWETLSTRTRLKLSGLRQVCERLGSRAGVHCHPHRFRRTCATWALRSGMSIYHVQAMLGHADLTVLKHYLHLVEADIQAAHRKHGPVDSNL